MTISDDQVAAIHSLVSRDPDSFRRNWEELGEHGIRHGYFELLTTCFIKAAQARFDQQKGRDIMNWLAGARAERDPYGKIDPNIAEDLLFWAFGKGSVDTMNSFDYFDHQAMLLVLIMDELGYEENALMSFLQDARSEAEEVQKYLGEA